MHSNRHSSVRPAATCDDAIGHSLRNLFRLDIDPTRTYGLDILRAVAISDVVVAHGSTMLPTRLQEMATYLSIDGVSVFFVLSGFLIGNILIALFERQPASIALLIHFWMRRWLRTLPAYCAVLLMLCALNESFTPGFSLASTRRYFVFAQNLSSPHPSFFPEAWSLSVEEWFYLLVPTLLFLQVRFARMTPRIAIITTALIIIGAVTAFRGYRHSLVDVHSLYEWDLLFRKQVVTRLDSLMFGVIGAATCFYHHHIWVTYKRQAFWCGIGLLAILKGAAFLSTLPPGGTFSTVFSFSFFSLATLLVLPLLSAHRTGHGFLYRTVTQVSLVSYSMYLLNLSVVQFWILDRGTNRDFDNEGMLAITVTQSAYYTIVPLLAILMYKYVELPMMKLRDNQWLRRRTMKQVDG
jgi:peptidoglycan/LPS O-acetylase OafA/YrhL